MLTKLINWIRRFFKNLRKFGSIFIQLELIYHRKMKNVNLKDKKKYIKKFSFQYLKLFKTLLRFSYAVYFFINYKFFYLTLLEYNFFYKSKFLNYIYSFKSKYFRKLNYFYYFLKKIIYKSILALIISIICILFLSMQKLFHFNKIMFIWFIIFYSNYLLFSGFIFFIKKYEFSKYVSAIQRYWRRTYIIFWIIETFLFLIFIYLTVNSNQEPFYMYDNIQAYKKHLYSWRPFLFKLLFMYFFIFINYYVLINLKYLHTKKLIIIILSTTFFLIYFIWLEFYQFFYVLSYYWNVNWVFDSNEKHWALENELKRTRMVNHYNNLLIILKFWHLIFIFFFWIFFIFRVKELERIRYPLFSANLQNFIILYIMAWIVMYPWLKYIFHKFLEIPYYWFFSNNLSYLFRLAFCDFQLYFAALIDFDYHYMRCFNNKSFFYWNNTYINFESCYDHKNFIKNWYLQNVLKKI